jgi:bifunctional non-homologous end joining protein LigD
MKAKLTGELPRGEGWVYEVKLDGIRAVAVKKEGTCRLYSRRPRDITARFPEIAQAVAALPVGAAVFDGEIVALDPQGRSSFQVLQNAGGGRRPPIRFYLFDLLNVEGKDLTGLTLIQRKDALQKLLGTARDPVHYSDLLDGKPEIIWSHIQKLGLEGLIAKRRDSLYEAGRRSGAWLKVKTHLEQEFVLGGYTAPQGARNHFGSILVGYYSKDKLIFASKVGTGFDFKILQTLHEQFQKLRTSDCPFSNLPARSGANGISRAEMKRCTWLEPKLVAQVSFMEWTADGGLRHPVFVGLRDDKKPHEVVRELPGR